ncbi:MAG: hypothetical protein Greene041619_164 [Candidatus Peregrinibacteria bacterium Greene0416_19]|nr:MAG: hypothetical protein Greene041619_164 [Candidatus Peregrinibacteria bacterium Greene0416_19]
MQVRSQSRGIASALAAALLLSVTAGASAQGDTPITTLLLLRPHCEAAEDLPSPSPSIADFVRQGTGQCTNYPVQDPQTQRTPPLTPESILDMDLFIYNADRKPVHQVRAWLSYDPQILEGVLITPGSDFPLLTPGEADFAVGEGQLRLGLTAETGKDPSAGLIVVARIQFRVKQGSDAGTPIAFHDLQPSVAGHTYITTADDPERTLLPPVLGTLLVITSATQETTPSTPPPPPPPAPSQPPEERTDFTLLQVQNVRIGTEGSTLYLAWDPIQSGRVAGYNIYYGTEKGRYIQRRSVAADAHATTLRGFVPGTLYYIGVRAVSMENEESAFSREVAIRVGDPRTSTSPLGIRSTRDQTAPDNPLLDGAGVPGESGASSWFIMFFLLSAGCGTVFAFRRQWVAQSVKMTIAPSVDLPLLAATSPTRDSTLS